MIRSIRPDRLARWCVGALMVLLAHGLGAPGSALAGCNNHLVTSRSDRQLDLHRLDDLITGGSSDVVAGDADRPAPAAPRPCSGPGCSGSVPRPASTASPVSAGRDQWAAMAAISGRVAESPSRPPLDETPARPARHRPSIFHPPPA